MKAFHNDVAVQKKYLDRIHAHAEADEFIKGTYWEKGKGCAVGCTIHSSNHRAYELELGIPEWIARLEDRIFEGLPSARAKTWPVEFLEAINLGSNLDKIKNPMLIFIVESSKEYARSERSKEICEDVLNLPKLRKARDDAAYDDAAAARENAYVKFADKLLELIRKCK